MATTTTNLGLTKPAYTDAADIAVINDNMDTLDLWAGQKNDAIAKVQSGLAYIVGNTNATGSTLSVGQYVYVKGHSTIAEGLRKVTSSISNGGSITTNNTEACSEGGLNSLFSNIEPKDIASSFTFDTTNHVDSVGVNAIQVGNLVNLIVTIRPKQKASIQNITWGTIASKYRPRTKQGICGCFVPTVSSQSTTMACPITIDTSGQIRTVNSGAYGGITNVTPLSEISFSVTYAI